MPFNVSWIIAFIGVCLATMIWAKTKRVGPAVTVFAGGLIIMVLADPSMLETLAEAVKGLIEEGIEKGINN